MKLKVGEIGIAQSFWPALAGTENEILNCRYYSDESLQDHLDRMSDSTAGSVTVIFKIKLKLIPTRFSYIHT